MYSQVNNLHDQYDNKQILKICYLTKENVHQSVVTLKPPAYYYVGLPL